MTILAAETFTPSPQQWALLGLFALIIVVYYVAKWRSRPLDGSPKQYRREIDAANRGSAEVRDDMERLLSELESLSNKMNAQLDEKHALLQDAMKDADQRIFALRTLVQAAKPTDDPAASSTGKGRLPPASEEPLIARVHALADAGLTAPEIAGRLEHHVGEIQLILNLRAAAKRARA